ncbi:hypothetical protein GCM10025867_42110 [Frondihabitans sucicola]|uniref:Uncharacterized protein n=1 Tax=Frondihabitans sucicola TaxID=1268041 RepID=A0ABM8GU22_9MICO|nr:hypothetical protein GCM10025867_42110 [Frondihabitans sucicola]
MRAASGSCAGAVEAPRESAVTAGAVVVSFDKEVFLTVIMEQYRSERRRRVSIPLTTDIRT